MLQREGHTLVRAAGEDAVPGARQAPVARQEDVGSGPEQHDEYDQEPGRMMRDFWEASEAPFGE